MQRKIAVLLAGIFLLAFSGLASADLVFTTSDDATVPNGTRKVWTVSADITSTPSTAVSLTEDWTTKHTSASTKDAVVFSFDDGKKVLVAERAKTSSDKDKLFIYSPSDLTVPLAEIKSHNISCAYDVAYSGNFLYVISYNTATVTKINAKNYKVIDETSAYAGGLTSPQGVGLAFHDNKLYALFQQAGVSSHLVEVDTTTNLSIHGKKNISLPEKVHTLASNGSKLYVASYGIDSSTSKIQRINTTLTTLLADDVVAANHGDFSPNSRFSAFAVDPSNENRLFVATENGSSTTVERINLSGGIYQNKNSSLVDLKGDQVQIAYDKVSGLLWAGNFDKTVNKTQIAAINPNTPSLLMDFTNAALATQAYSIAAVANIPKSKTSVPPVTNPIAATETVISATQTSSGVTVVLSVPTSVGAINAGDNIDFYFVPQGANKGVVISKNVNASDIVVGAPNDTVTISFSQSELSDLKAGTKYTIKYENTTTTPTGTGYGNSTTSALNFTGFSRNNSGGGSGGGCAAGTFPALFAIVALAAGLKLRRSTKA